MTASQPSILGLVELAFEESDDVRSQAISSVLHEAFNNRLSDWIRPKDEFNFVKKNRADAGAGTDASSNEGDEA